MYYNILVNKFQSTLPRGERQAYFSKFVFFFTISIHAPARGATALLSALLYCFSFQSTLPRGERRNWGDFFQAFSNISIHAPARGATLHPYSQILCAHNFNPRSREGSDIFEFRCTYMLTRFQSTLPRGERLTFPSSSTIALPFQSTLPRGERRLSFARLTPINSNFNPRSREGSDRTSVLFYTYCTTFQSTLPRGERRYFP